MESEILTREIIHLIEAEKITCLPSNLRAALNDGIARKNIEEGTEDYENYCILHDALVEAEKAMLEIGNE